VTFAPNSSPRVGISPVIRTFLFWILMIFLAVVLWKMAQSNKNGGGWQTISYSDFMQHVDRNDVASVKLYTSQSTAEIQGEFRQPPQGFKVTIPKEVIPNLTERLRNQGSLVEVLEAANTGWANFAMNIAPFILLVSFWIFMMRRMRAKREPSAPIDQSNRPIG
jgi:cell division protease FtsH